MTENFLEILVLLSKNNEKIRQKTARPGKIQSVFWRFLSLQREFQKIFLSFFIQFLYIPWGENICFCMYNIHVVHLSKYKFFSGLIFFKVSQKFCIFYTHVMYVFLKKILLLVYDLVTNFIKILIILGKHTTVQPK